MPDLYFAALPSWLGLHLSGVANQYPIDLSKDLIAIHPCQVQVLHVLYMCIQDIALKIFAFILRIRCA